MVDRPAHAATVRPAPVELALWLVWRVASGLGSLLAARSARVGATPRRRSDRPDDPEGTVKRVAPPPVLYHYTCNHSLNGIIADRAVMPNPHPWLGVPLVWLTDLDIPDRAALGLIANRLARCDRTANRVDVRRTMVMQPWADWARNRDVPALVREMIEGGGALPMHWWVSPVAAEALTFHPARGHVGAVFA